MFDIVYYKYMWWKLSLILFLPLKLKYIYAPV